MVKNIQQKELIHFKNNSILAQVWGALLERHPNDDSVLAFPFDNGGGDPEGALWLTSVEDFVNAFWPYGEEALDIAVEAGAEIVWGWKFEYAVATEVPVEFCGFSAKGAGYSLEYPAANQEAS
jgi:hypothetical protein